MTMEAFRANFWAYLTQAYSQQLPFFLSLKDWLCQMQHQQLKSDICAIQKVWTTSIRRSAVSAAKSLTHQKSYLHAWLNVLVHYDLEGVSQLDGQCNCTFSKQLCCIYNGESLNTSVFNLSLASIVMSVWNRT